MCVMFPSITVKKILGVGGANSPIKQRMWNDVEGGMEIWHLCVFHVLNLKNITVFSSLPHRLDVFVCSPSRLFHVQIENVHKNR